VAQAAAELREVIGSAKTLRCAAGYGHNGGVRAACSVTAVVIAALTGCGAELDPNQVRDAASLPDVVDADVVDAPADARESACYSSTRNSATERGATVGKMAMGLRVVSDQGQRLIFLNATGRYFAKIISAIILCIGFIMIAFTDRKRGLHDMIAGTLVIKPR